ncbi:hypothetical protein BKK51_01820 [Rodentibacter trehalosifermentans]|uniref:Uncharacterized protein n=1 Tax=Rodentibacter trehalosifermentans TaxID=1908263 RepID=A0A1V3IWM7_9PAST|nr:hypothetical protein [Rodentibacter trehalosifermentans]OOF46683.1 hypothetical protein BKK51_01820 [Rodentibacter trehalosifermentans]
MRLILLILMTLGLNGCFLFMHRCDSLTGWCSSGGKSLHEYNVWETKKEFFNLKDNFTLTLSPREREEENNKKKIILSKCNIDPNTGDILGGVSKDYAYNCAYRKGICNRNDRYPCSKLYD